MSERFLTPELVDLIMADVVRPALFIFADFPSGAQRFWTGSEDIEWDGFTWKAVGGAISFDAVAETVDTAAKGLAARLSGLDTALTHKIISDAYQGNIAIVYVAFWDWNGTHELVFAPEPLWRGQLDTDHSEVNGETTELIVNSEHRLIDILRKREYRYSDRDQALLFPDMLDTGLNKLPSVIDASIPWGKAQA